MLLIWLWIYLYQVAVETSHLAVPTYHFEELNTGVLLAKVEVRAIIIVFFLNLKRSCFVVCDFHKLKGVIAAV